MALLYQTVIAVSMCIEKMQMLFIFLLVRHLVSGPIWRIDFWAGRQWKNEYFSLKYTEGGEISKLQHWLIWNKELSIPVWLDKCCNKNKDSRTFFLIQVTLLSYSNTNSTVTLNKQ